MRRTILLMPDKNKSFFAKELINDFHIQYEFKMIIQNVQDAKLVI